MYGIDPYQISQPTDLYRLRVNDSEPIDKVFTMRIEFTTKQTHDLSQRPTMHP